MDDKNKHPANIDGEIKSARRGGKVPGSGRKKGTRNKLPGDVKELILARGKPAQLLCDVAAGRRIRVAPKPGASKPEFVYPTLTERVEAATALLRKVLPDLKAQEFSGSGGVPVEEIRRSIIDVNFVGQMGSVEISQHTAPALNDASTTARAAAAPQVPRPPHSTVPWRRLQADRGPAPILFSEYEVLED